MVHPVISSSILIVCSLVSWASFAQTTTSFRVDPVSMECMSCHDRDVPTDVSPWSRTNHPYGIDYEAYATLPWNIGRYADPDDLDPSIRLPDGRITCVTCHEQKLPEEQGDEHGRRNVTEHRGKLCLSCHLRPGSG